MGLTFTLSRADFETKDRAREEALRRFPTHRVAGIVNADDANWEVLVEPSNPAPLHRARRANPFPIKPMGDEGESQDEDENEDENEGDEGKSKKKLAPPKDKKEDDKEPSEETDPVAKAKELVSLLEKLVPKLKNLVGGDSDLDLDLDSIEPIEKPPLGPPDGPGGPGAGKMGPGGPPPSSMPTTPPGGRRKPGKPSQPPVAPLPVFTHARRTRLVECATNISYDDALTALSSEYPDYNVEEIRRTGNRWVAKLVLGDDESVDTTS